MLLGVINCNVYHVTNRSERKPITCRRDIITLRLTTTTLSNPHSLFYHESYDFSASLMVSRPYKLISRVVHFAV